MSIDALGYPVEVGGDTRAQVAALAARFAPGRAIVLADHRVRGRARAIAQAFGPGTLVLKFTLGERRKTLGTLERVLDALVRARADRSTLILSVGGGVASDLFGFAAATYMRGVPFAAVATSLVGMADAAIGGKSGVDLRGGKNLAGAFADPVAVFCDIESLRTLPVRQLREGLAEIVKAGLISGENEFAQLESYARLPLRRWPWEEVVAAAVGTKCAVVRQDRDERGVRAVLNLGHTFGHAIEHAAGYRISHGAGVAIGLRGAGLLALRTGRFSAAEQARVIELLQRVRLPVVMPNLRVDDVLGAMRTDKKNRGGALQFVLPQAIGSVEFGVQAGSDVVRDVLAELKHRPRSRRRR